MTGADWLGRWKSRPILSTSGCTGREGDNQGNHDKRKLRQWASRIQQWRCTLSRSFVYFNNDQGGDALADSQTLRAMVAPGFAAPPKAA
jgi:uncharacterized protein YecE (DUF72 family)